MFHDAFPILANVVVGAFLQTESGIRRIPQRLEPIAPVETSVLVAWDGDPTPVEVRWSFSVPTDGLGLAVETSDFSGRSQTVVLRDVIVGPIIDLTARAARMDGGRRLILVGLGSLNATADSVDYRYMLRILADPLELSSEWLHSPVLVSRPFRDRFDALSISFSKQGSVMFGLHVYGRQDGEGEIESHYFVDHCPDWGSHGQTLKICTDHYVAMLGSRQLRERAALHDLKVEPQNNDGLQVPEWTSFEDRRKRMAPDIIGPPTTTPKPERE